MSGVAGGTRILKQDVDATFNKYVQEVLTKVPGFKKASLSGSVKAKSKADFGDLDLIVWFEGDDKREVKQRLIDTIEKLPTKVIVPFPEKKEIEGPDGEVQVVGSNYPGKRYYNSGELISVLYPIEGQSDQFIQVDNIIALTEEEHTFKGSFLDIPAEKQGLLIGLAKVILVEQDPQQVFERMGISGLPPLEKGKVYEFTLSSVKLSLRMEEDRSPEGVAAKELTQVVKGATFKLGEDSWKVTKNPTDNTVEAINQNKEVKTFTRDDFTAANIFPTNPKDKTQTNRDVWSTTSWGAIKTLFRGFNIDGSWEDLLDDVSKKLQSPTSKKRVAGTFRAMVSVKTGEIGKDKGKNKEIAREKVLQTLSEALDEQPNVVAIYAGGFKPPHLAHFANAQFLASKADLLKIYIGRGTKDRAGINITPEQSLAIWEIYKKYITTPVEVKISPKSPITDTYDWVKDNQPKVDKILTGAIASEIPAKFGTFIKNPDLFPKVEIVELPVIEDKQDKKLSAEGGEVKKVSGTTIRTNQEYLLSGKWIPKEVTNVKDRQAIIDMITPKEEEPTIEDKMLNAVDEVFESFFPKKQVVDLDIDKYNHPIPLSSYFTKALQEVTLSTANAVKVNGGPLSGTFTVGTSTYRYSIKQMARSPYNDDGTFYNIAFHPGKEAVSTPQGGKENYTKILSTMYKIITDFVKSSQPDYIGIGSLDNEGGKNYHQVYANLTDNRHNRIPGYFRKDVSMPFDTPQGSGRMVVLKKKQVDSEIEEGSSGTPIQPSGAIPSKDRAELLHLFNDLRASIDSDKYTVVFNQDRIDIYIKTYSDVSFDQTPWQKHLPGSVEQEKFNYTPYLASILEYMLDEGMNIQPLPEIKVRYDEEQANDFFGKTAYYDPNNREVILYAMGRLPKDVCRSFTHEMIHHIQNVEGRLGNIGTTNTNEDSHLQEIEKEAHSKGSYIFRMWEDLVKNGESKKKVMAEGRYDKISNQASSDLFRAWKQAFEAGQEEIRVKKSYFTDDIEFDVEGVLLIKPGLGKMEVVDSTGAGFDDDADYILVHMAIDPELLPNFWEEISMTLKDIFRHEIEHLTHNRGGFSTNPAKVMQGDTKRRDKIKAGELPVNRYFKLKKEVDANLQGMLFRAKKEKRPFADVVNTYLDSQKITPKQKQEILTLWRNRMPALGIRQTL